MQLPAQGDCVDLSTRIYLDHHQLGSVAGREAWVWWRRLLGHQMLSQWIGNLQAGPWLQCCQRVWCWYYPGSTCGGFAGSMRMLKPVGWCTTGRATGRAMGVDYSLGCSGGSVTVCLETSWNSASSLPAWTSPGVLATSSQSVAGLFTVSCLSACIGQWSDWSHHRHVAPLTNGRALVGRVRIATLITVERGGKGIWHGWRMLRQLPLQ